jgi:hypothetical protein
MVFQGGARRGAHICGSRRAGGEAMRPTRREKRPLFPPFAVHPEEKRPTREPKRPTGDKKRPTRTPKRPLFLPLQRNGQKRGLFFSQKHHLSGRAGHKNRDCARKTRFIVQRNVRCGVTRGAGHPASGIRHPKRKAKAPGGDRRGTQGRGHRAWAIGHGQSALRSRRAPFATWAPIADCRFPIDHPRFPFPLPHRPYCTE